MACVLQLKKFLVTIALNATTSMTRNTERHLVQKTGGLKTGAAACRDQQGNLVTDIQGMLLGLWRKHFDGLLNGDTNTNKVEPEISIADDGIDIPPPPY